MNSRFHEMLAQFSGNRFVLQAIEQIDRLREFQEFASFTADSQALVQSCKEHLAILDAIDARNREWASALMRRRLAEGAERGLCPGHPAGTEVDAERARS